MTSEHGGLRPAIAGLAALAVIATGATMALRLPETAAATRATTRPTTSSPTFRAPRPFPAVSRSSPPARRADPFGSAGAALADSHPGQVLATVYDVTTGQEWSVGHGRPQAEASVVKLDILETLLARHRSSGVTLPDAELPITQQMMEYSDNASATDLWYAAGGPGDIGTYNTAAGLRDTALSGCVNCPGFPWPGWGLSTTTPGDQITLLRQLVPGGPGSAGSTLPASQRAYALSMMENVTPSQAWGVSGGVPAGVTVAVKNGWLPLDGNSDWQVNSVGWVSGDGRDYLLAVLTTGNLTEQDGISLISDLAADVWRGLG